MAGKLYIVGTPIGNLHDTSPRVLEVLRSVDMIACEDTRHTQKLLTHFRISNRLISYHEHNERERADELTDRLVAGDSIAVVTDAGMPCIADPGFRIVERAGESGIEVIAIPGPTAFVAAAAVSGLPTDSLFFGSFLPSKKGERRRRLAEVRDIPATLVFYETPHRIVASLKDCLDTLGDRRAAISREITKLHEETLRGRLSQLIDHLERARCRGEIVLVIERGDDTVPPIDDRSVTDMVADLESQGIERKTALKSVAKQLGISKSEAYRIFESER